MSEQPLPVPGQVSVTDALIADLRARQARGIATYGRSLETHNGRSAPRDLSEELLDAAQYAKQWELERSDLLARIQVLEQRLLALVGRCEKLAEGLEFWRRKAAKWDQMGPELLRAE
ncbi:MAG TPA: hypothetical protein VFU47_02365 [Armatimonadota bacterium]|nr:hypothetical protein [Armatimonadota bacterium]